MSSNIQRKIDTYLKETGLSVAALEKKAGLKINVLRNIVKGQSKRPTAETLHKIANAMGCTVPDLLGVKVSGEFGSNTVTDSTPNLESLDLFQEAIQAVLESIEETHGKITVRQALNLVEEVYLYSLKKEPPVIDKDFVKWLTEKTFN